MNRTHVCEDCGAELPTDTTEGLCPRCLLGAAAGLCSAGVSPASSPSVSLGGDSGGGTPPELAVEDGRATRSRRFGDYELLEQIASGGMGIVYKARQVRLNRVVAIKTLPFGRFTRETFVKRFQAEAETAAKLRHPNIVAIHEVGEHEGQPYFSMDYVDGASLAEVTHDQPLAIPRAVRFVRTIAEAVHYAHSMGILHRDLKPSNILIDRLDQPHITDFGLAKDLKSERELTLTGETLGSPNYIPPEQIDGKRGSAGPHTDVYALGAVLYHLLTGRPPFVGESLTATLQQVANTDPAAPRLLNPAISRDLETICLKCLEKEPSKRYGTAQEVADDLGRWQANEPIRARPISPMQKAWRWCERKPGLAAALALVFLLFIVLGIGGPLAAYRINQERQTAVGERKAAQAAATLAKAEATRAEAEATRASTTATHLELQRIEDLFTAGETSIALTTLARLVREQPENRTAVERLLSALTWRSFAVVRQEYAGTAGASVSAMSADGRWIATATASGKVLLHDLEAGHLVNENNSGNVDWRGLIFSPDGNFLLARSVQGAAQVFALPSLEPVGSPMRHAQALNMARFSFDGSRVVTASDDTTARVWNAMTGQPLTPPMKHDRPVISACFSPDGRHVLTVANDVFATLWDADSGRDILRRWSSWPLRFAEFLPDGESFVAGAAHGWLHRWSTRTGELLVQSQHANEPSSIAFDGDGKRCAVTSLSGSVRLLDSETLSLIDDSFKHDGPSRSAAFSADALRLCSGGDDNAARIWNLVTGRPVSFPVRHPGWVSGVQLSPDNRHLFSRSQWSNAMLCDIEDGSAHSLVFARHAVVMDGRFAPDGEQIALGWSDGVLELRDARGAKRPRQLARLPGAVRVVEFSRDSGRILTLDEAGTLRVFETASGHLLAEIRGHREGVTSAHLSADGQRCLTASLDGTAVLWSVPGGKRMATIHHSAPIWRAVFSPDSAGGLVATTGADFKARVWNADSGKPEGPDFPNGEFEDLRFSPDGNFLLAAGKGSFARLVDWRSGREVVPVLRHENWLLSARFSPDGARIVTASSDRTVRVWDARTGQALTAPMRHPDGVTYAEFDSAGERIASACADGAARIWDAATGLPRGEPLRDTGKLLLAQFDAKGERLLTIGPGSIARVWDVPTIKASAPAWLPGLAEAMTSQRQLTNRTIEDYPTAAASLTNERAIRDSERDNFFSDWGRWFFADRRTRRTSPWSSVAIRDWIGEATAADLPETLREAAQVRPDDPHVLARLTHATLNQSSQENPRRVPVADWLSQRALALAPQDPLAVIARADWLNRQGRLLEAIACEEALPENARTHGHFWESIGILYQLAGRNEDALNAFNRSVDSMPGSVPSFFSGSTKFSLLNRSAVLRKLGRLEAAAKDFHDAMNIPPRDGRATSFQVNLDLYYTHSLDENPDDPGNNWSAVPHGLQIFDGVEFDVRASVWAAAWSDAKDPKAQVKAIPLGFRCHRLHFLHTGETKFPDGTPFGKYIIHFANGETREWPLIMEQNIGAAWVPTWRPRTLGSNCRIAWSGTNPASKAHDHAIWLYAATWENPLPDIKIDSIDIVAVPPRSFVGLLGITGEE